MAEDWRLCYERKGETERSWLTHLQDAPRQRPRKAAELSGDGNWATVWMEDGKTPQAVWVRLGGESKAKKGA